MPGYCPDCGEKLHVCEAEIEDPAAELARAEVKVAKEYTDSEVEVARLQAERDVAIAKITAGVYKDEAVQEAEVVTAEAEGIMEALAPEPAEEEGADVIIVADAEAEAEPEEPSLPEAEEQGGEPVTTSSKSSNPWW